MAELRLLVNGRSYGGWKGVRVKRSIESLAGSFDLEASDRWGGQDQPWPIAEEDACRVELDGVVVLDGFVDRRSLTLGEAARLSGRDRAAALVDNSAILEHWTFRNAGVLELARKVAEPFGVAVSLQPGLALPPPQRKIVVSPGDTPYQVIQRAAAPAGVLVVSDGAGGITITRAGARRAATPLVEGQNVLAASIEYDATERFRTYVVATQVAGTDTAFAGATRIRATAIDEGVRRADRVLMIRPETGMTTELARQRADWEARIRAARAEAVSVVVQGWKQPGGELWPLGGIYHVQIPWIGVDGDLVASELEHALDGGGQTTQIRLVRPDAFAPEPVKAKVGKGGEFWKELAGGAR